MGHKRTIRPNAKRLSALFMARDKMDWDTFAKKVKSCQRGFIGEPEEIKPGRGEFHEYPSPCICQRTSNLTNVLPEYHDEEQNSGSIPIVSAIKLKKQYNNISSDKLSGGQRPQQNRNTTTVEEHKSD